MFSFFTMVRGTLFFLLLLTCCPIANCQKHVVSNPNKNVIYWGIPNPLDVVVEGYKCKEIIAITNNGKIEMDDGGCTYFVTADSVGTAKISISLRNKPNKFLGHTIFRVKHIPAPTAVVAGKSGGEIRKIVLRAQIDIAAVLLDFGFDLRLVITEYKVTILDKGETLFVKECSDARFSKEVKQAFDNIGIGNTVLFTGIKCTAPGIRTANHIFSGGKLRGRFAV